MKTITFEAKPIETAPKDRYIYLYAHRHWCIGKWDDQRFYKKPLPLWNYNSSWRNEYMRENPPTHWADIPGPGEEE